MEKKRGKQEKKGSRNEFPKKKGSKKSGVYSFKKLPMKPCPGKDRNQTKTLKDPEQAGNACFVGEENSTKKNWETR